MLKTKRQNAILSLIDSDAISKQEDLAARLKGMGFGVNQSSISRDLLELGIIKIDGRYARPGRSPVDSFGLNGIEAAGENLLVAKTDPGLASAACVKIDKERIPGIVGTIAGEDTIFIAIKEKENSGKIIREIWEIFG